MVLTGAVMLGGLSEIMKMLRKRSLKPAFVLAFTGGLLILTGTYIYNDLFWGPVIVFLIFVHLIASIFFYPDYSTSDFTATLFGTLYVSLIVYIYLIETLAGGRYWLFLLLLVTWANDVFAYFVGKIYGRRKLAKKLSPGKTLEGAVGGLIAGLAVTLVFIFLSPLSSPYKILGLGASVVVTAQIGDLAESVIKRHAGLKDSGKLIPGHGGILDRFDSLLFAAPSAYYYIKYFLLS